MHGDCSVACATIAQRVWRLNTARDAMAAEQARHNHIRRLLARGTQVRTQTVRRAANTYRVPRNGPSTTLRRNGEIKK